MHHYGTGTRLSISVHPCNLARFLPLCRVVSVDEALCVLSLQVLEGLPCVMPHPLVALPLNAVVHALFAHTLATLQPFHLLLVDHCLHPIQALVLAGGAKPIALWNSPLEWRVHAQKVHPKLGLVLTIALDDGVVSRRVTREADGAR